MGPGDSVGDEGVVFGRGHRYGLDPNDFEVPTEIPESGYTVLDELNGKPGYYIEMFSTNVIASSLGKDQFSVSVLALAICLVGLRLLTRHYITEPIDELKHMSRDLMEGKLDAEVVVDGKSDFADLQRLLQSGKLLISKMDEIE